MKQTELQEQVVELSARSFEAFCRNVTDAFDVEGMSCRQQEVCVENVAGLAKRFGKLSAVNVVKAEGALSGAFQLVFDQDGVFTLGGVIIMLPKQIIVKIREAGSPDEAASLSDAIQEIGKVLVVVWDKVFRAGFERHGHFVHSHSLVGDCWDKAEEKIGLGENTEVLYVGFEMTVQPFGPFKCGVVFPKAILAWRGEDDRQAEEEQVAEQVKDEVAESEERPEESSADSGSGQAKEEQVTEQVKDEVAESEERPEESSADSGSGQAEEEQVAEQVKDEVAESEERPEESSADSGSGQAEEEQVAEQVKDEVAESEERPEESSADSGSGQAEEKQVAEQVKDEVAESEERPEESSADSGSGQAEEEQVTEQVKDEVAEGDETEEEPSADGAVGAEPGEVAETDKSVESEACEASRQAEQPSEQQPASVSEAALADDSEPAAQEEARGGPGQPVSDAIRKMKQSSAGPSGASGEQSSAAEAVGFGELSAKDVMRKEVVWVDSEDTVEQTLTKMQQHNVSYVLAGKDGAMEGLVSMFDVQAALSPYLQDIFSKWRRRLDTATLQIKVKWIMSRPVRTARAEDKLADIMESMCRRGDRCMPVVDEQDKAVGLITVFDIFQSLLTSQHPAR